MKMVKFFNKKNLILDFSNLKRNLFNTYGNECPKFRNKLSLEEISEDHIRYKKISNENSQIIPKHDKEDIYNFFIKENNSKLTKVSSNTKEDSIYKNFDSKNSLKINAVEGDCQANDITYEFKKSLKFDSGQKLKNFYSNDNRRFNTDFNNKETHFDNNNLVNYGPLSIRPISYKNFEENLFKEYKENQNENQKNNINRFDNSVIKDEIIENNEPNNFDSRR